MVEPRATLRTSRLETNQQSHLLVIASGDVGMTQAVSALTQGQ